MQIFHWAKCAGIMFRRLFTEALKRKAIGEGIERIIMRSSPLNIHVSHVLDWQN